MEISFRQEPKPKYWAEDAFRITKGIDPNLCPQCGEGYVFWNYEDSEDRQLQEKHLMLTTISNYQSA